MKKFRRLHLFTASLNSLVILGLLYVLIYFILVFFRIQYPYELEWMEGNSLEQVRRILANQSLYSRPTLDYVSYIYPPLYFYLSAALSLLTGPGFVPLRLVSFLATLGSMVIIFQFVRRETRSYLWSVLACCFFCATFQIGGSWFDVGRVDNLFLFFLLAGIYLIRFSLSWKGWLLAGVCLALAFMTKQTALPIGLPLVFYCLLKNWRWGLAITGTFLGLSALQILIFNLFTDNWYSYYIFYLPSLHSLPGFKDLSGMLEAYSAFWLIDVLSQTAPAFGLALLYLFLQLSRPFKKEALLYLFWLGAVLAACWVARLNTGGYKNVLLPVYATLAIFLGMSAHKILKQFQKMNTATNSLLSVCLVAGCLLQFGLVFYNPLAQLPQSKDVRAGDDLVNFIRQTPGEVFVPYHCYLLTAAGKNKGCPHFAALEEFLGGYSNGKNKTQYGLDLLDELRQRLREKYYAAIILDNPPEFWLKDELAQYYVIQSSAVADPEAFWPVTGRLTKPQLIYVPR